jgi:hypothetical protein
MEKNQSFPMERGSEDIKPKSELDEHVENGESTESKEFKIQEAKLRRKLDLFIAPVMMLLMLISYLDRGNIGFAATQGMSEDIGLKGNQLNVCPLIFCHMNHSTHSRPRPRSPSFISSTF